MNTDLDCQGSNDASGANKVVLAQVVQGLVQNDCSSLEPYWLLELDALKLLQILQNNTNNCNQGIWKANY